MSALPAWCERSIFEVVGTFIQFLFNPATTVNIFCPECYKQMISVALSFGI